MYINLYIYIYKCIIYIYVYLLYIYMYNVIYYIICIYRTGLEFRKNIVLLKKSLNFNVQKAQIALKRLSNVINGFFS